MTKAQLIEKLRANKVISITDKQAEKLTANEMITSDQLEMLQEADTEQLKMMASLIEGLMAEPAAPEEPAEPVAEEPTPEEPVAAATADPEKIAAQVRHDIERDQIAERIAVHEDCPYEIGELKAMTKDQVAKLEKVLRPKDFSGQGGFATNSQAVDANSRPLVLNHGVITGPKKEA